MTPWLSLQNVASSLKCKISTDSVSASGVIILSIIMITVRLIVGLQALPCPSTGKFDRQWRALWVQAIPQLLRHPSNLLNERVCSLCLAEGCIMVQAVT
jgi:hypothetical protein